MAKVHAKPIVHTVWRRASGYAAAVTPVRLRLYTGLWLLFYAATHLINHALGLISLAAAEGGRIVFLAFWRQPVIELTLLLAVLVHIVFGVWTLWQRRTLRMGVHEALQLGLGLLIPVYLTAHVLGTGWLHRCCGVEDSYSYLLTRLWPQGADQQAVMVLLVWLHGTIGLHYWLRLRPGYHRIQPWLLMVATMVPMLALAGFVSAGREVAASRALDPQAWAALAAEQRWPTAAVRDAWVDGPAYWIVRGFVALVVLVMVLRTIRWAWLRRRNVHLTYPGGREVNVPRGLTILEASRLIGVPHASVCGGHGRCSTCRVRVGQGRERLPPPSPAERRVLARIGAAADVRLACQTRPVAHLAVTPLMPATAGTGAVLSPMSPSYGIEREIVVLFADLRDFTRVSEGRLPYDTVFILNRYFTAMGSAIEAAGGQVDKFIGDGIMALFGITGAPDAAARAALDATRRMAVALIALNRELAIELDQPLRMGMGLHLGPVILGEMGHGRTMSLTAIGDTVNVASRLEALTKELGCQLVVSQTVASRGASGLQGHSRQEVDVRGRTGRLEVIAIEDAAALPQAVGEGRSVHARWRRLLAGVAWLPRLREDGR